MLPCNRNLHKLGKRDTNLCYFCQEEESISHLLYYCTRAKPIWDLIQNVMTVDDHITHDMVIFGYDTDNVLNHLLSIIVYYIYVLNVFIDIQTSKELIQMDTDKIMTYGTFTMDDEKLTQS